MFCKFFSTNKKTIFKRPKKKIEVMSRSAQIRSKEEKTRDLTQIKGGFKKKKETISSFKQEGPKIFQFLKQKVTEMNEKRVKKKEEKKNEIKNTR